MKTKEYLIKNFIPIAKEEAEGLTDVIECLESIEHYLSIPMDAVVKHDFADIVEEFKKRIDRLVEKNEKATYYNNGLRKAYMILQQVQDDMEL